GPASVRSLRIGHRCPTLIDAAGWGRGGGAGGGRGKGSRGQGAGPAGRRLLLCRNVSPPSLAATSHGKGARMTDTQGHIERRGIDLVPESARYGKPRDLMFLWAGTTTTVFTVVYGAFVVALGLSFVQSGG